MSWSREESLTDPAIRNPLVLLSEFRFSLKNIPTEITVRLYRPVHSGRVVARRSHDISISGVKGQQPPETEPEDTASEGDVLHIAVNELVAVYNAARAQGLTPDPSWLKPNKDFC